MSLFPDYSWNSFLLFPQYVTVQCYCECQCQPVFIQILNNQLHIIYLLSGVNLGMLPSLLLIGEDTDS